MKITKKKLAEHRAKLPKMQEMFDRERLIMDSDLRPGEDLAFGSLAFYFRSDKNTRDRIREFFYT
jgi:hypothetical protein